MTREEIRKRILFLLNEDVDTPVFFTEAQANTVISEAFEIIAEEVTDLRKEAFITIRPGRYLYTLADIGPDVMTPFRVWSETDERRLDVITMTQLDDFRERWLEVTSDRPEWWYPFSHDTFGIFPSPTLGGGILRVDYLAWPTALVDDNDRPVFKENEQDLAILYGLYDGLIRQWEHERAVDVFVQFINSFRDSKFKNATRRFQHQFFHGDSAGFHSSRL
jgi:hypothetical protein